MQNNKARLIPIKTIALLGIVSAAYAQTCYYETSKICVYTGTNVGTIYLGGTDTENVYADGDWESTDVTTTPPGSPSGQSYTTGACSGPAYYYDLGVRNTISHFTDETGHWNYAVPAAPSC